MISRINKIINWDGKEYAHIIETRPSQFCDLCALSNWCEKVIDRELAYDESPMKICSELCDAENTHFAMFIEADKAEEYVLNINKHEKR